VRNDHKRTAAAVKAVHQALLHRLLPLGVEEEVVHVTQEGAG
jgi:hypothetical protein